MADGIDLSTGRGLIACPHCDALHRRVAVPEDLRARCTRCGATLIAPRAGAVASIVSLATAALILLVVAVSFPFLRIEASGLASEASVIDAVLAFAGGSELMLPLSVATAALIVALPALRLSALVYALAPLVRGRPPLPQAARVFRLSMRLRPWAMGEIFMLGVAVALIKVGGLADITFGPAFWAFGVLVLFVAAKDAVLCERTIWQALTTDTRR